MKTIMISQRELFHTKTGVPRKVFDEIQFFSKNGHKVYAVAEKIDKDLVRQHGGIPLKTWRWPFSGYFRRKFYDRQFKKLVAKLKPDLIIGHGGIIEQDLLYMHDCVHLKSELADQKPIDPKDQVARLHFEILTQKKYKMIICNSQMMKDDFHQRFGIPLDKMHVIHPEVKLQQFDPAGKEKNYAAYRKELGIKEDEVLIGLITSGNFKKRNVGLLLETTQALIKNTDKKFKVIIAGKNNEPHFEQQAKNMGLGHVVSFLPAINQVEKYYYAIDIFVLPAFIEEFGRSVTEAMACGNPIVVSKKVGSTEILPAEMHKYILEKLTVPEFTQKLLPLIESAELRKELGLKNQQIVKSFSSENQNQKLADLLKKLPF